MNHATCLRTRALEWLRAGLLIALLAGCGGGVDSGGTGGATVTYANGPISGYGSIFVNGVRFDDSSPSLSVSDEDGPRGKGELKLGMVVEVRATAIVMDASGTRSSSATSISFGSAIVGPIRAIDRTAKTLIVLGQMVEIKPATVFDDTLPGGLAALASGEIVEVYALYNAAQNVYAATRIERKSVAPDEFRIRGKVSGLSDIKTFMLGTELIAYDTLADSDVPAALSNGAIIRVRVSNSQVNGVWMATRLRDGLDLPDNGTHAQVEGLIENFSVNQGIAQFKVNGVDVATNVSTLFEPAGTTDADLGDGVLIEVEGSFVNGLLVAEKVELEDESGPSEFELRGPIEDVDVVDKTIRVRGQVVSYAAAPQYLPLGKLERDLKIDVNVEVKATLVDGNRLQATRIEFK